jgi:hypothetical protein
MQSENIADLATALSKLQGALEGAKKDSTNPSFKSKYADLEAVWEAARPLLVPNGLSVTQTMGIRESSGFQTTLITTLLHSSGQWISGEMPLLLETQDPQGQGSAITYARRYCLAAILGIHQTDDDAESAQPNRPSEGQKYAGKAKEANLWSKDKAHLQNKNPIPQEYGPDRPSNKEDEAGDVRKLREAALSADTPTTAEPKAGDTEKGVLDVGRQELPRDVENEESATAEKGDSAKKISAVKRGLLGVLAYAVEKGYTEQEVDTYIKERFGITEETASTLTPTAFAVIVNHFQKTKT